MDLNSIYNLIDTEFKVTKKEKGFICVAPLGGEAYPETIVKLTLNRVQNQYELFEVVRGKEYKVDTFIHEYKSVLALYIFAKSKLEVKNYDANVKNKIKVATSLTDIEQIFKTSIDEQYYSFLVLKQDKIILEKSKNDKYNVLFLGKKDSKVYIDKSRNMNSAAAILYNFSIKLRQFHYLINKVDAKGDTDFIETLKELYLIG